MEIFHIRPLVHHTLVYYTWRATVWMASPSPLMWLWRPRSQTSSSSTASSRRWSLSSWPSLGIPQQTWRRHWRGRRRGRRSWPPPSRATASNAWTSPSRSGQEELWIPETGVSSRSCVTGSRWTRSAVWSRTAASWPSSGPTHCGMQDTPLIGVEADTWSLEWRLKSPHFIFHSEIIIRLSNISILWFVFMTRRDWCIAIALGDVSLGAMWTMIIPLMDTVALCCSLLEVQVLFTINLSTLSNGVNQQHNFRFVFSKVLD